MKRSLALGLVSGLLAVLITSGVMAAELVTVVRGQSRVSKHILFVVDVSGSMYGRAFTRAVSSVRSLAGQPTDEMQVGVIAFADTAVRWSPTKHSTWAKLPDKKALVAVENFLYQQGPGGGTKVVPALELALQDPKPQLTVVLVTDGIFSEPDADVLKAVEKEQKQRVKKKRGRALIAVLGVGSKQAILEKLGKTGKGGYYRTAD